MAALDTRGQPSVGQEGWVVLSHAEAERVSVDQDGPQLALVIPTYRWNTLARETLAQAAAIGSDEIVVHIADNSVNTEKHAFLRDLAARSTNVVVTCNERNIGADGSWLFLIKAQTTPYICLAADDDSFSGAYFRAGIALLRDNPSCSTAAGFHVSIAHGDGKIPSVHVSSERREIRALDRIRRYRGQNAICYAISRRTVIRGFADLVEANPLPCPFYDYLLAFHLLSMGTYRLDPRGYVYIYDNTNWQLNDAFIKSNMRWYKGYGLPEAFGYLTRLHWAVVVVFFFSSTFRSPDLTNEDAESIVSYLFDRQRREFANDYYKYRPEIAALFVDHGEAAAALARLMSHPYSRIEAIFDDFAMVVAVFSPSIASRSRAFQAATLQPHADTIRASAFAPLKSILTMTRARANATLARAFG